jgi:tetratricopeptide (TPR) repeat protein
MTDEKKPQVFLSYASENLDMVRKVYDGLVKRKLNVWFDKEHLKPGKWKPQIERAIRRSRFFIICLSNAAIRKTGDEPGFQDHELNEAYNIARDQADQEFTIIPVRLEDCRRGDHRLTLFQQYDLFEDFDGKLDKLAVNLGGISLSDPTAKDERTDNEKLAADLLAKANAEYYAGRLQQSITLYDSVLVLSPDHGEAWYNKGLALLHSSNHAEAIKSCEQAMRVKPDLVKAIWGIDLAPGLLDKPEELIKAYILAFIADLEVPP